jgi:hypothetical protein
MIAQQPDQQPSPILATMIPNQTNNASTFGQFFSDHTTNPSKSQQNHPNHCTTTDFSETNCQLGNNHKMSSLPYSSPANHVVLQLLLIVLSMKIHQQQIHFFFLVYTASPLGPLSEMNPAI